MKQLTLDRNYSNLIFEFRGLKVMVDIDLATLYETETKKLKQQVKRNQSRFPEDFMFELSVLEKDQLLALAPRLESLKYSSVTPMVFTEQGVAMLSSILSSKKAIQMNIEIMRAFAKYRALILENSELRKEIYEPDKKLNAAFLHLLKKIDALTPRYVNRKKIGYKKVG